MANHMEDDKKQKNKKDMPIPPSATFVDVSGKLEKKKGMSDSSNEGLNDSTQCSF
ncbi:MAG: hypothetical protein K0S60_501 [Evtepia sp.]|jgi:hypothetical protein|nr:hypothetical protein [Evtepia sp.]